MRTTTSDSSGFIGILRALADSLVGSVQDRVELFSVELQIEKFRLIRTAIGISAAIVTGVMALTLVSFLIVYVFWESARLAVLGGLAAFYAVAFVLIVLQLRRSLARQPRPFAGTLEELAADRQCIRARH